MIIAACDTETTDLDSNIGEIVEIGLVVYDTIAQQILAMHSDLLQTTHWSEAAEKIHKITREMSQRGYGPEYNPWPLISHYKPQLIVAHNAAFDKQFITKRWPEFGSLPWLCTKDDLQHDLLIDHSSGRLQHLAVDYDLIPGRKHRALFDALLCVEIAAKHDLEKSIGMLSEERFKIETWYHGKIDFSSPEFNTKKDALKKLGFKWDGSRWSKVLPKSQVDKYMGALTSTKSKWQVTCNPI